MTWQPGEALEWVRTSPLLGVLLTLGAYRVGLWLHARSGRHPVTQPVLVAVVLVSTVLLATGTAYADYARGGDLVAFALAPATVALAVPLHRQAHHLRRLLVPLLVAIPLGAVLSIGVGYGVVVALGGDETLARTMAPKAATTPVSIALSADVGGIVALTAVLTIGVGIVSAVLGPWLLTLARVRHPHARGVAMGAVSHGIGTSRSLADDPEEGAFAGLAMGLTALATAVLLPVFLHVVALIGS
ncbi:LrgB family protein [Nocardioides zeae]|uniref:LrgB family protein n=1 Tax=Nocardioides imazamoxiresistens TaxID=3231893 RepID=A0ABU3PS91_9ACTN|nr:LrgB family protein [Nocardioides zeae]MDT9592061.1 LrgB family protein [Nocardioides zeae]